MQSRTSRETSRVLRALGATAIIVLGLAACVPSTASDSAPEPAPALSAKPEPSEKPMPEMLLLASLAYSDEIAIIDPALPDAEAVVDHIVVGAAPWGVGVHGETAYAATSEGLAVVDLMAGERTALVPYEHQTSRRETGEYRPGGLGLAVSPDGARVYVAVTPDGANNWLEVFDTASGIFIGSVPVGARPFDVLAAPDGSWVATVDHDSFTVTVVDATSLVPIEYTVAPFGKVGGLASWEKPHYGAVANDGTIYLPYQGLAVARLDPLTGNYDTITSVANSHAHGTALAGDTLVTVGTGAFGNATGSANLSILDVATGEERIVSLDPPHETVAIWVDSEGAQFAAAAGGNTRDMGWNGVTLVSLDNLAVRSINVPGYPQHIVSFARG